MIYKHTFYYFLGNKKYPEIYILHTDGDWDGGKDYSPKQASTNPNSKASIEGA